MKTKMMIVTVATMLGANAAQAGFCVVGEIMTRGHNCDGLGAVLSCAPEVQHGNMASVDKTLKGLAANDLKTAPMFGALVTKASTLPESERMSAYLALMGVQSDDDIVAIAGAREIDAKYVDALAKNAQLTPAQSRLVLENVSHAMLGERK